MDQALKPKDRDATSTTEEVDSSARHDRRLLVVDLDHTLINTDMLFESFWAATSKKPAVPLLAAKALRQGRPALKAFLQSAASELRVESLPYNQAVLDTIASWKDTGGRVALVSASDDRWVQSIAAHLGLFDEAHGSTTDRNLKGRIKADFLVKRYGQGNFDYVRDSALSSSWPRQAMSLTKGNRSNTL